jgi:hypothetical protein
MLRAKMSIKILFYLFFLFHVAWSFELLSDESFNWSLANITVSLSAEAYCDPETYLERDFSKVSPYVQNFKPTYRIRSVESHDVNGFVGSMETSIYIVFRGSQSFSNFVDDFDIRTREEYCTGCLVHKGFYEATQSVLPDVLDEISRLQTKNPKLDDIVITGHSLGAALATIAALDLAKKGFHVKLINFGSPRLANSNLAEYISKMLPIRLRVTNHRDPVPHLPLFALGFDHIQGEYYEDENAFVHECMGTSDPTCSSQWTHMEWSRIDIPSLHDHLQYLNQRMGSEICKIER